MMFGAISSDQNGCCLVRHENTVYKVKILFLDDEETGDGHCDSAVLRADLEQVFRAVLYLDQREQPLTPMYTDHLLVKPLKKDWTIWDRIQFQQNGKGLEPKRHFFEFHVYRRRVINEKSEEKKDGSASELDQGYEINRETADTEIVSEEDSCSHQRTKTGKPKHVEDGQMRAKKVDKQKHDGRETKNIDHDCQGNASKLTRSAQKRGSEEHINDSPRKIRKSASCQGKYSTDSSSSGSCHGVSTQRETTYTPTSNQSDQDKIANHTRGKRKPNSSVNVDDITGFSYKVRKFQLKLASPKPDKMDKRKRHVLYKASGHSPIKELPQVATTPLVETTEQRGGRPQVETTRTTKQRGDISRPHVASTSPQTGRQYVETAPLCTGHDKTSDPEESHERNQDQVATLNCKPARASRVMELFGDTQDHRVDHTDHGQSEISNGERPKRCTAPLTSDGTSTECDRLLRLRRSSEHTVVTGTDRHLVAQEELHEIMKLQEMASTHAQTGVHHPQNPQRSGLWNFIDTSVITPVKKHFLRKRVL